MKQYTNQEWLNIFSEVSSGNISAVRAMQKYNVSHSMYYKMKNKLASSNQEFQEAVILDQTNENDYIIISKNGFDLRFTHSTYIELLRRLTGVLNDL